MEANLTYRPPLDLDALLHFLARRAVPGVESWDGRVYTKLLELPGGAGMARVPADVDSRGRAGPALRCTIHLEDIRDYPTAVSRLRRLLDLDADPGAVAGVLGADPHLGPMVLAAPGRRVPGSAAPFETAVRAVIGQQVSVASARVATARVVELFGRPVTAGGDWYAFPRPEDLAAAEPARLPLPGRRAQAVVNLSREVASGRIGLDPGADRDRTERLLLDLPGIGPWTAAYIRLRALGDPDVFPPGDAALERARATLHSDAAGPATPLTWKPWRSYAAAHLWAAAGPERSDGPEPPPRKRRLP